MNKKIKNILAGYKTRINNSINPAKTKTQAIEFFNLLYESNGCSEVMMNYCITKINNY